MVLIEFLKATVCSFSNTHLHHSYACICNIFTFYLYIGSYPVSLTSITISLVYKIGKKPVEKKDHYTRAKISNLEELLERIEREIQDWIERENRDWKKFVNADNKVLRDSMAVSEAEMMNMLKYLIRDMKVTNTRPTEQSWIHFQAHLT